MTIDNINTLIVADESRTLELKKTTGELKDGMHTACAFLNTEGGWLIFGITPKSLKIIGQKVTDNTQQEIAQALAGLEPMVDVKVEYVDVPAYPGNKVIAMHFDGWVWGEHPHTYNGCPYYKVESTTSIAIYDDRIEIANPGVFPPQITPENIKKPHESYPYNLKIAEALYKSTFLESWGSGAKRIIDACDRQGVEEPTWKWDSGFIIVTFKRHKKSIKYIYKKYDTETETVTESVNVPVNVPVNIPANLSKLNDRQRNIYNAIKNSTTNVPVNVPVNAPVNATNLAIWLNVSEKTIKRDLSFMQSAGIIKRVGSDKTGHWEVIK